MNYYGRFYRSAMHPLLRRVSSYLRRWAGKKYREAADRQEVPAVVDRGDRSTTRPVRPMEVGPWLLTDRRMRRAG
jgi:RNA-directed DNA polymerase